MKLKSWMLSLPWLLSNHPSYNILQKIKNVTFSDDFFLKNAIKSVLWQIRHSSPAKRISMSQRDRPGQIFLGMTPWPPWLDSTWIRRRQDRFPSIPPSFFTISTANCLDFLRIQPQIVWIFCGFYCLWEAVMTVCFFLLKQKIYITTIHIISLIS